MMGELETLFTIRKKWPSCGEIHKINCINLLSYVQNDFKIKLLKLLKWGVIFWKMQIPALSVRGPVGVILKI